MEYTWIAVPVSMLPLSQNLHGIVRLVGLGVLRRAGLVVASGSVKTQGAVSVELAGQGIACKSNGDAELGVSGGEWILCGGCDAHRRTTPVRGWVSQWQNRQVTESSCGHTEGDQLGRDLPEGSETLRDGVCCANRRVSWVWPWGERKIGRSEVGAGLPLCSSFCRYRLAPVQ